MRMKKLWYIGVTCFYFAIATPIEIDRHDEDTKGPVLISANIDLVNVADSKDTCNIEQLADNDLDTMIDEMVNCGATGDIEAMAPSKWKLFLAYITSKIISAGILCENITTTVVNKCKYVVGL